LTYLIEEEDGGVGDELDANGGALALAPGDALDERTADESVGALLQLQLRQQRVDLGRARRRAERSARAQRGGEVQCFARRLRLLERVVLHDVCDVAAEGHRVDDTAAEAHLAAHPDAAAGGVALAADAPGKDVEQRRLARAGRAHERGEVMGGAAGDAVEDILPARGERDAGPLQPALPPGGGGSTHGQAHVGRGAAFELGDFSGELFGTVTYDISHWR
jgi:hypothetical protein